MSKRISTRRDFLLGQSAADALADLAAGGDQPTISAGPALAWNTESAHEAYLVHVARQAMACEFEILLNAGQYQHGIEDAVAALDLVETLEQQMTIYRDDSELMDVNRRAGSEAIVVDPQLFELLEHCCRLHRETGGAFDITSTPLTRAWGFDRRAGAVPDPAILTAALAAVGSDAIELDATRRTVRFLKPGMELNLGSIGKGFALDQVADQLLSANIENFLIHGGQSSVLARGRRAADAPWSVGVLHPLKADVRLAEVQLEHGALATSGNTQQFFRHQGRRYGHVLDPRSGWPAEGVFSTTVLAPTAAEADALATAFYVLGVSESVAYCETHPAIGLLMLHPSPSGSRIELTTAGLDDARWRLLSDLTA